jgi:CheY-like chemotaxis protein
VFAIALTGYAQPLDREEALAAGFDAHLAKPPDFDELDRLLAKVARRMG